MVVYKDTIREKPLSEEEAREFIKGFVQSKLIITVEEQYIYTDIHIFMCDYDLYVGYSGGMAAVVGSVVVTNLTTGTRKGGWERAEVSISIFRCFLK